MTYRWKLLPTAYGQDPQPSAQSYVLPQMIITPVG
jgi:hypothetical protein